MNDNKEILKYCPNYYDILEFNPMQSDELTKRIIRLYREYIFKININNEDDVNSVKELDAAVIKYINDYNFRREIEKGIRSFKVSKDSKDIIKEIIKIIINVFSKYQDFTTRVIYISRWI